MTNQPRFSEAELARLADGTLPADREAELSAAAERSPELAAALAQQRRAVSLLRAVDEPAPESLRARIEALTEAGRPGPQSSDREPSSGAPGRRRATGRWRPRLALPVVAALAIVVAAVVVLLNGQGSAPTVPQTVPVTLAAATLPAPIHDPTDRYVLGLGVDGIRFPNWERTTGWSAAGARRDTIAGRDVVTVFYTGPEGRRVGYAIVSGKPLAPGGGTSVKYAGVTYTFQRHGAARLITWVRSGHTCVIAGRAVGYPTLLTLASADNV